MDILEKGDSGVQVANWQRFLITRGFHIEADGDFGPATELATRQFQASVGLRADGKVGDQTYKASQPASVGSQQPDPDTQPITATPSLGNTYNEVKLQQVHPALAHRARKVLEAAKRDGYELRITQGLRTFKAQDEIYAQGRTKPGKIVSGARAGQSMHNYGLAVDFAFVVAGKISWDEKLYKNLGPWASSAGLEWGGGWRRFKDLPHCQLPNLPSYKVLRPIYDKGGLPAVWAKFN